MTIKKCGYVGIVGRPNVGKSTLMNHLIGEKVSIISPKPQTTRSQLYGIKTINDAQIIYIDTPGMHSDAPHAMNRYMNRVADSVLHDANVIIFVIDAKVWREEDQMVLEKLKNVEQPVILAINKIDALDDKALLLPLIEKLSLRAEFKHIVPISALRDENIDRLQEMIIELLPESEAIFPEDQLTDKSVRYLTAEIIREKLIHATEEELPYTTAVEIEQFKEDEKITEISAVIWVERDGQRIIVIGKKGAKLKKIGIQARRDIEKLLGAKVFLRLWVKVREHWTDDDKALRSLGYD